MKDTQPILTEGPPLLNEQSSDAGGPGCFIWGLMVVFGGGLSVLIVALAGTAGWTAGEHEANMIATTTQEYRIEQQLIRIPEDVVVGNTYNLKKRLNFLETEVPHIPVIPQLRDTATAVYLDLLPTVTRTPTQTYTPTVEASPSAVSTETSDATESPYDLIGLLQSARDALALGNNEEAYETLDAIIRIDPDFQRATVRGLMLDALTRQANLLFQNTDTLAEAIRLTDLAETYGDIDDLSYERLLGGYYLDVQRAIGAGDHLSAINILNTMRSYQTSYKGQNLNRLLFNELTAYARAYEAGAESCQAVVHYNSALTLFVDNSVIALRDNAQAICEQGTPTPIDGVSADGTVLPGQTPLAPVGVGN